MLLPGKRIKTALVLGVFVSSLCLPIMRGILAQTNISESETAKKELKERNEELKKELQKSRDSIKQEGDNKNELDKQINIVKEQIDNSNQYILKLENEINALEDQISEINKDMEAKLEILKESLYSIYVAGDTFAIDIILQSKTFEDFLDKADIIRSVSETINGIIEKLNESRKKVEENKAKVEEKKAQAEEESKVLKENQENLQVLLDKSEALLESLQTEEQNVKQHLDENDEELKKIEAQIEQYYEQQRIKEEQERRRKEAEEKKKKQQAAQNTGSNNTQETSSSAGTSVVGSGDFVWPVPGFYYISSDYYDTVGRSSMHGAIDIAGKSIYGTGVVAADSGTVIFSNSSGYGGGYGKYIIIDHGNGKSTLYAHMSGLAVEKGQVVKKGQTVGYVGSTGYSTGPHLHFETRLYGKKYNPMTEFKQ